jgi:3'(2'), 5'-bisphosphate nucleotidase
MSEPLSTSKAPEPGAFLLPDALVETVLNAVYAAGAAILEVYGREDFAVENKADDSPLTAADRAAHRVLQAALEATPYPVLSEEGRAIPFEERSQWDALWVVDPLDGTKEFIKRNGEFTVNVALVNGGVPVFGVVYAPVLGWVFLGDAQRGAFHATTPVTWEDLKADKLQREARQEAFRVVASRSHNSEATESLLARWEEKHGPLERVSMGSSLKICWVAAGRADAYPRLAPTMEWDTAAGQAVAEATGCSVLVVHQDAEGNLHWDKPLRYNRPDLLNPWFLVCGSPYLCTHA